MIPAILVREGTCHGLAWRQYFVITDGRVAIVHMTPAMLGWNVGRIDVQTGDDWPRMTRDAIVDWKLRNCNDGLTMVAPDLGEFRATLLTRAGV